MEKLTYADFSKKMYAHNDALKKQGLSISKNAIAGVVVISQESFNKPYSLIERSYKVWSDNKAYDSSMGGYSIYASCLDGSEHIRLERYIGVPNGWKVEYCYFLDGASND